MNDCLQVEISLIRKHFHHEKSCFLAVSDDVRFVVWWYTVAWKYKKSSIKMRVNYGEFWGKDFCLSKNCNLKKYIFFHSLCGAWRMHRCFSDDFHVDGRSSGFQNSNSLIVINSDARASVDLEYFVIFFEASEVGGSSCGHATDENAIIGVFVRSGTQST